MKIALFAGLACLAFGGAAAHAQASGEVGMNIGKIMPGHSTKADVESLLGKPWRVEQFNDCGMAMDDQADETWEYRGTAAGGSYRIHVEFGDDGFVHLIAKMPDRNPGGKAVAAQASGDMKGMSM